MSTMEAGFVDCGDFLNDHGENGHKTGFHHVIICLTIRIEWTEYTLYFRKETGYCLVLGKGQTGILIS